MDGLWTFWGAGKLCASLDHSPSHAALRSWMSLSPPADGQLSKGRRCISSVFGHNNIEKSLKPTSAQEIILWTQHHGNEALMLLPLGTLVSGLYYLCWSIPHPTVPTLSSWVPALGWNKWSALSHHLWVLVWSLDDSHTTTQRTSSGRWSGGGASFQRKPLG